jgi:hypothetical protein
VPVDTSEKERGVREATRVALCHQVVAVHVIPKANYKRVATDVDLEEHCDTEKYEGLIENAQYRRKNKSKKEIRAENGKMKVSSARARKCVGLGVACASAAKLSTLQQLNSVAALPSPAGNTPDRSLFHNMIIYRNTENDASYPSESALSESI